MTTALFVKENLKGVISLAELGGRALLVSGESSGRLPYAEYQDDVETARLAFRKAITLTKKRGWKLIYQGPVLWG
jgi:hypothetical protein